MRGKLRLFYQVVLEGRWYLENGRLLPLKAWGPGACQPPPSPTPLYVP
jgi:hypothetical protein